MLSWISLETDAKSASASVHASLAIGKSTKDCKLAERAAKHLARSGMPPITSCSCPQSEARQAGGSSQDGCIHLAPTVPERCISSVRTEPSGTAPTVARSSFAGAANRAPGRASQAPRRAPQQRSTSQPRSVRPPVLHVHQPVGAVLWDKLLAQHHWAQRQVIVASPAGSPTGTSGKQGARSTRDSRQPQPLSLGSRAHTSHTTGWPTLSGQEWQDRSRSVRSKGRSSHVPGDQQSWVRHRTGHRLRSPYARTRCPAATSARRALPARALIKHSPLHACTGVPKTLHLLPTAGPRGNGLQRNRTTPLCCCSTQLEPGVVGSAGHPGTQRHQASLVTASPGVSCAAAHAYHHGSPSHCAGLIVLEHAPARKARFSGAGVALGQNLHDLAPNARPKGRGPNIALQRQVRGVLPGALIKSNPRRACTGVPKTLHLLPTAGPWGNVLQRNRTTPLRRCSTQLEPGVVGSAGHPGTQRHQASFVTVSP